jgi:aspartate aminotransferase
MKWPADRITNTSAKSFGMYERALQAKNAADLIHLELGSPCHDTPQVVKDAVAQALREGKVHYGNIQGELAFREALAAKLSQFNRIPAKPQDIIVTNGLTHASYLAFMAALDPGDEVILPEPYYPQHLNKIELAGGKPIFAPLRSDQGFQIELETFMPYISPDTRMIVLVNPSNPTGRVYRNDELEVVARVAVEHDLLVVTDEVYEQVVFPGHRHISLATLPGMAERTISLFAFTKAFAMDGWRLGYLHAPTHMISAMLKISMNDVTHVNTFIQYGGLAALTAAGHSVQDMVADDCLKRDMVVERLNAMSGVRCSVPEGTIYVFPNIERTGLSSTRIAELLLEKAAVVVEDGAFYGRAGRGHLRVCFGSQGLDKLQLAMDRMTDFFHRIGASDEAGY